jgi:hypothetical protein
MVSVRVAYPGIVHLGIKRSKNGPAIGRNVAHGDRKGVDGAGVVNVNASCATAES